MNLFLTCFLINPFVIAFLLIPPIIIIGNAFREKRSPYWLLLLGFMLTGWVCVFFGTDWYFSALEEKITNTSNPPKEWIENLTADGAIRVFGLFFGWLYSAIYFMAWLIPTLIVSKLVKSIRTRTLNKSPENNQK